MDPRERRLAENETIFRSVNERIEQLASPQAHDGHVFEFLCECSNLDCTLRLPLTIAEYEEIRATPTVFVVAPGHDLPEIEEIIRRTPTHQIVKKHGEAAELAAVRDPRS